MDNGATAVPNDTPDKGRMLPWLLAAVIVFGGAAFLVGRSEGEGLSEEDFVGTWITHDGVYIQFNEDSTLTAAWSLDDLDEGTINRGRWSLDGSEFSIDEDGPGCHGAGYYTVEPVENGAVKWTLIVMTPARRVRQTSMQVRCDRTLRDREGHTGKWLTRSAFVSTDEGPIVAMQ